MTINRRQFVQGATAAGALATVPSVAMGADTIKFGSILDTSGIFEAYGKPMEKAHRLAIDEINAGGGLLGKKIEMIPYDTQSKMALYTQYARRMTRKDKVDVIHGGILSASREAIRPSLRKAKTLYFYNTTYEGGVCDRNVFCVGTTPAQQSAILVPEAIKRWGKKIYVLAADYNYGQITSNWIKFYAQKAGGEVIQADYFPLNVSDFGSTIAKIQKAKPDIVCCVLVGLAHLSFYRQWAAAGMKKKIPIATTTMSSGNEHKILTPSEGDGIVVCQSFSPQADFPSNKAFLAAWKKKFGHTNDIHEIAASSYDGVRLWAEGVKKAGSLDRMKVIQALETGLSYTGPTGKVTIDPKTHHVTHDMHLIEVKNQTLTILKSYSQIPPSDTQRVCDLEKNPNDTKQYEIKI